MLELNFPLPPPSIGIDHDFHYRKTSIKFESFKDDLEYLVRNLLLPKYNKDFYDYIGGLIWQLTHEYKRYYSDQPYLQIFHTLDSLKYSIKTLNKSQYGFNFMIIVQHKPFTLNNIYISHLSESIEQFTVTYYE